MAEQPLHRRAAAAWAEQQRTGLADGTAADAWVYLAGPRVAAALRTDPAPVASGDWADA